MLLFLYITMRRVTNIDKSMHVTFICSLYYYTSRQRFGNVDENNCFASVIVRLSQIQNEKNLHLVTFLVKVETFVSKSVK